MDEVSWGFCVGLGLTEWWHKGSRCGEYEVILSGVTVVQLWSRLPERGGQTTMEVGPGLIPYQ